MTMHSTRIHVLPGDRIPDLPWPGTPEELKELWTAVTQNREHC